MRKKIRLTALRYLGYPSVPYTDRNQGQNPEYGFDCSGFVTCILRQINFPIRFHCRRAYEFFDNFGVFIHDEIRDIGDLIFFSSNGLRPNHIGILISPDKFIHAPGRKNSRVRISKIRNRPIKHLKKGYIYVKNPIGFKRPAIWNGEMYVLE